MLGRATGGRRVGCGLGVGVCLTSVGVGVAVAVGVGVGVRVAVGVAVAVAVAVGVNVAVAVGVKVAVAVGVNVAVGVGVNVAVAVGVGVNVAVGVGVNVAVAVAVGVNVAVAVAVGVNVAVAVAVAVGVGVGVVIVNVCELDLPPPGLGLETVTHAVPADAIRAAGTVTLSCVEETNVTGARLVLPPLQPACHSTVEEVVKLVPFRVKVNDPDPATALFGLIEVSVGTAASTLFAAANTRSNGRSFLIDKS